jgi:double-stranded uracil-DNA glycosylase
LDRNIGRWRATTFPDISTFVQEHSVLKLDLEAAKDATIPDVLPPPGGAFGVLFVGINPGLYSAATGYHFARPGNRFWPALYRSGFTPRLLRPDDQLELLGLGLGITNLVARATARADELTGEELIAGGRLLAAKVASLRPRWLAVVGVTAFRTGFGIPRATTGPQELFIGETAVWALPNPSGLNAHWNLDSLTAEFARLRIASV